jgi:hypothetical protein
MGRETWRNILSPSILQLLRNILTILGKIYVGHATQFSQFSGVTNPARVSFCAPNLCISQIRKSLGFLVTINGMIYHPVGLINGAPHLVHCFLIQDFLIAIAIFRSLGGIVTG